MKTLCFLIIGLTAIFIMFSIFLYTNYGWLALVAYLVFMAICLTPSMVSLYRWHKKKGSAK